MATIKSLTSSATRIYQVESQQHRAPRSLTAKRLISIRPIVALLLGAPRYEIPGHQRQARKSVDSRSRAPFNLSVRARTLRTEKSRQFAPFSRLVGAPRQPPKNTWPLAPRRHLPPNCTRTLPSRKIRSRRNTSAKLRLALNQLIRGRLLNCSVRLVSVLQAVSSARGQRCAALLRPPVIACPVITGLPYRYPGRCSHIARD